MNLKSILQNFTYVYSQEKAEKLKKERWINIQTIIDKLKNYQICQVLPNHNYEDQIYILVKCKLSNQDYPVLVPIKIIENKQEVVIKTAFPSRKFKDLISNC